MSSPIPIQNVYYLLVYSWNSLAEGELTDVSRLESSELADLLAAVLCTGITNLLRRGLDQNYVEHRAEISGVKGRIIIGTTVRRMLTAHGRTYCQFDELKVDTLPNQILRSTVQHLIHAPNLSTELRKKLVTVKAQLGGISSIPLTKHAFRKVQLHGNNRVYRFLLKVCELALDLHLVDESSGTYRFRDFIRDKRRLARLFESFLFNFYKIHRPDLSIKKERIYWQAGSKNDPELRFLPSMETDISIRDKERGQTLIIDAKFYEQTFQKYYDSETVHSGNLYQLFAYLKNLEVRGGPDANADGMLIYPVIDRSVRLAYQLPGHIVHISTVNLAAPWRDIQEELLDLLSNFPSTKALIST